MPESLHSHCGTSVLRCEVYFSSSKTLCICTSFLKYFWILSAHSFYITFSYKFGNKISSKGIGWGMVIVSGVATLYYIMLLTWSLFYLINCFRDPLPWKFCSGSGNRTDCTDFRNNVSLLMPVISSQFKK